MVRKGDEVNVDGNGLTWNKNPRKKSSSEMAELQLVMKAVNGGQRVGVSFMRVRR